MDKKEFDNLIREKINNITIPGEEDVWQTFEARQSTTDLENHTFDQAIRQKIQNHHLPYNESHWQVMEDRMEIMLNRIYSIAVSKGVECLAVILIASTYFTWSYSSFQAPKGVERETLTAQTSFHHFGPLASHIKSKSSIIQRSQDFDNPFIKEIANVPESHDAGHSIKKDAARSLTFPVAKLPESRLWPFTTNPREYKSITSTEKNMPSLSATESDLMPALFLEKIPASRNPELSSEMAFSMGTKRMEQELLFPTRYSLAGYASADVNMINTPFDKLYSISSYKKESVNQSFGIGFSGRKGNVEWETALEYVNRQYRPAQITETFGQGPDYYFETSLKKINFLITGIPIHIKYHFLSSPSWSAYLVASTQLNLVMTASYEIEESLKHGRPQPGRYTPEVPRLDEKPFIKGILHGDALADNYYISAGLGLGIQKTIFSGTFLYIQPSYSRHLLSKDIGIGPNKDKIHGTSLQVGIKTTLW